MPGPCIWPKSFYIIRLALGLSQSEIHNRVELEGVADYTRISRYETGKNEPSLVILLRYARLAGVCMDELVDDEIKLPQRLTKGLTKDVCGRRQCQGEAVSIKSSCSKMDHF